MRTLVALIAATSTTPLRQRHTVAKQPVRKPFESAPQRIVVSQDHSGIPTTGSLHPKLWAIDAPQRTPCAHYAPTPGPRAASQRPKASIAAGHRCELPIDASKCLVCKQRKQAVSELLTAQTNAPTTLIQRVKAKATEQRSIRQNENEPLAAHGGLRINAFHKGF
jgi:hypothetical protein